jgi:hypothetical protein
MGKGLISGFTGTLAITAAQMIEMQITKREGRNSPVIVAGKALGVEPRGKAEVEKQKTASQESNVPDKLEQKVQTNTAQFSQIMHFSYGTAWGMARGFLDLLGIRGLWGCGLHFLGIWVTALVMLPSAGASKPATKWPPSQILMDVIFHAVYASAAGGMFDAMVKAEKRGKKCWWKRRLRRRW